MRHSGEVVGEEEVAHRSLWMSSMPLSQVCGIVANIVFPPYMVHILALSSWPLSLSLPTSLLFYDIVFAEVGQSRVPDVDV